MNPTAALLLATSILVLPSSILAKPKGCQCPPEPSGPASVVRTFVADRAATEATAFWTLGHPFRDGEVPAGSYIAGATLGGAAVPASCIAPIRYSSGAMRWCQVLVDFSARPLERGDSLDLILQIARGAADDETTRSDADWTALGDVLRLSDLTTTGVIAPDTVGSGGWTCAFDGGASNTVEKYGSSPQGLFVEVAAQCTDGGTTHRNIFAVMDYWVTQKADGSKGPIESWGPYLFNTKMHPAAPALSTLARFDYTAEFARGGMAKRTFRGVEQQPWSVFGMTRPDGQGDWTDHDPNIWVTPYGKEQTIRVLADTNQFPPVREEINASTYKGQAGHRASTAIKGIDTAYDQLTVASRVDVSYGMQGSVRTILQRPVAVELTASDPPRRRRHHHHRPERADLRLPDGVMPETIYFANSQIQLASQNCQDGVVTATTDSGALPWPVGDGPNVKITGSKPDAYANSSTAGTPIKVSGPGTFTYEVPACVGAATTIGQLELLNDKIILWDNFADAIRFGTTGKIDIVGAGSCLSEPGSCVSQNAVAPGSPGQWNQTVNPTGSWPFLATLPENTVNYFSGNTRAYQRNARVNTISFGGFPVMGNDADVITDIPWPLRLISLLDPEQTPDGMVSDTTVTYGSNSGSPSKNINGGAHPGTVAARTTGGWGTDAAHAPNGHYLVWLMEGTPILRDLTLLYANGISARTTAGVRNTSVDGKVHYNSAACTQQVGSIRAGAWSTRNKFLALAAAPAGPLHDYFRADVQSEADFCNSYHNYQASYPAGVQAYWEDTARPPEGNTINMGWFQPGQHAYLSSAIALGDILTSDWVPEVREVTKFLAHWSEQRYNSPDVCPRLAVTYTQNVQLGSPGDPSPGSFIGSYKDLGYGTGSSVLVTVSSGSPALASLTGTPPWGTALADGDILRLVDYPTNDVKKVYPWFDNPDDGWMKANAYYVRGKSGNSFHLSKTPDGPLMDNSGVLRAVGAWYVWQPKNGCLPGVAPGSGGLGPTSPTAINTAALAIMVRLGLASQAAWDTADQRNPSADYNAVSTWAWKP